MGRWLVPAGVLAIAACGRVNFDGRGDGGATDDGSDAATAFSPPQLVVSDPVQLVTNPTVRADELEMFVIVRAAMGQQGDVYVTRRNTPNDAWGQLQIVASLNSGGDESGLHLDRSGLVMWFASIRAGGLGSHDIYRTTRPSFIGAWATPQHIAEVSSTDDESSPATDVAELAIVLNVGLGPRHLSAATRTPGASWSALQRVTELEMFDESGPALTPDGLTMYYAADRTGAGTSDLWVTHRATTTSPFAMPTRLDEVSSPSTENVPWISADERVIYFTSDRDGRLAIYRSERQ